MAELLTQALAVVIIVGFCGIVIHVAAIIRFRNRSVRATTVPLAILGGIFTAVALFESHHDMTQSGARGLMHSGVVMIAVAGLAEVLLRRRGR